MTEYVAFCKCKNKNGYAFIRAYESSLEKFNHEIRVNGYKICYSCTFKNFPKVASRYYSKKEKTYISEDEFIGLFKEVKHYSNYWIISSNYRNYPEFD